jgi:hypothetical protein
VSGWHGWRNLIPSVDRLSAGWMRVRQDATIVVIAGFLVGVLLNGIGTILFFELVEWLELGRLDPQPTGPAAHAAG